MGKFLGFLICLIFGIFLLGLSFISDELTCSRELNTCNLKSKIKHTDYVISEQVFDVNTVNSAYCGKEFQPSRSGKKAYFVLKLQTTEREYNLGSYKKYKLCTADLAPINAFIKGKSPQLVFVSGSGFTNFFGFILAILMFVVGIVILTSQSESDEVDWDEENMEKQ